MKDKEMNDYLDVKWYKVGETEYHADFANGVVARLVGSPNGGGRFTWGMTVSDDTFLLGASRIGYMVNCDADEAKRMATKSIRRDAAKYGM